MKAGRSPVDPDMQARDRVGILLGLRVGGGVLIALALWMFLGGSLGGGYGFGGVLCVVGLIGALVVPRMLIRKWRTPR